MRFVFRHSTITAAATLLAASLWAGEPQEVQRASVDMLPTEYSNSEDDSPVAIERLEKEMQSKGWVIKQRPDPREGHRVVEKRAGAGVIRYDVNTKIKYSWVAIARSAELPPGSKRHVVFHLGHPRSIECVYILADGHTLRHDVMGGPICLVPEDEAVNTIRLTHTTPPQRIRKMILLQQRFELIKDQKVIEAGYLNTLKMCVFEQRD